MITIRPADAIIEEIHGFQSRYIDSAEWFVVYEHFARQLIARDTGEYAPLNNTSSINNRTLDPLSSRDAARKHLVALFREVGDAWRGGEFLRSCGINTWADLDKPIQVRGWKPQLFANQRWFHVMGRRFKSPGPNSCHRTARFVYYGSLGFSVHERRWQYQLEYGYPYPDDSARWHTGLRQNLKESREHFAGRVNEWLAAKLIAEASHEADARERRVRDWLSACRACETLFDVDEYKAEGKVADAAVALDGINARGDRRIPLTKSRLRTLLQWAKGATDKSKRRNR